MNNSQLIKTLSKKRTANFREDETRLLIALWGSPQIQNKLNLTHRKAPVMRLIAANMQQRGFYRSPDEIKTRIRNLKCLYHRIKRTITSGSGIGTVDPDWPHFKAMDAILGDSAGKMSNGGTNNNIKPDLDNSSDHFEIKQEIDINDDMESWNGNDSMGSDYDEELAPTLAEPAITITTAPPSQPSISKSAPTVINSQLQKQQIIMGQANNNQTPTSQVQRTITCTPQTTIRSTGQTQNLTLPPSIPLPFLILNNLKPAQTGVTTQSNSISLDNGPPSKRRKENEDHGYEGTLMQLLDVQKNMLEVEKERLDVEKQRLEFDRLVGSQLMTLVPMMASLLQRLVFPNIDTLKNFDLNNAENSPDDLLHQDVDDAPLLPPLQPQQQRSRDEFERNAEEELEKNRNILRNLLNEGLKARMLEQSRKEQEEAEIEKTTSTIDESTDEQSEEISAEVVVELNETEDTSEENKNDENKDNDKNHNEDGDNVQEDIINTEEDNDDTNENDDNESCVLLINEDNSVGANDDN